MAVRSTIPGCLCILHQRIEPHHYCILYVKLNVLRCGASEAGALQQPEAGAAADDDDPPSLRQKQHVRCFCVAHERVFRYDVTECRGITAASSWRISR